MAKRYPLLSRSIEKSSLGGRVDHGRCRPRAAQRRIGRYRFIGVGAKSAIVQIHTRVARVRVALRQDLGSLLPGSSCLLFFLAGKECFSS